MAIVKTTQDFALRLKNWLCLREQVQKLFDHHVSIPKTVPLRLTEAIELIRKNVGTGERKELVLEKVLSQRFPLRVNRDQIRVLVDAIKENRDIVYFPIDQEQIKAELIANRQNLYEGKRLSHGLLFISEMGPEKIRIELNPRYELAKDNKLGSTAENIRRGVTGLIYGDKADDSIRSLIEGDLKAKIKYLAQGHPGEVRKAIESGEFDQVLVRQDKDCLQKILQQLVSAIIKLEIIYRSDELKDILPFLPPATVEAVAKELAWEGKVAPAGIACHQFEELIQTLTPTRREKILKIIKNQKEEGREILASAKKQIEIITGLKLKHLPAASLTGVEEGDIRQAIQAAYQENIFKLMLPSQVEEIPKTISESKRKKIKEEILGSNLMKNVKELLLNIMAEKEEICIAMYSFSSPLFAAALLAAMLRGAKVSVLLDPEQAKQKESQRDTLINQALALTQQFQKAGCGSLEVRLFTGTLHEKNILLRGEGTVIMGSPNFSFRAMTINLEKFKVIPDDEVTKAEIEEFEEFFAASGSYVPLTKETLKERWIWRSGIRGIRVDHPATPSEIQEIVNRITGLRIADFRNVRNILEIAKGGKFEFVVDLADSFQPFMAEIQNPVISHFLREFFRRVPLGFSFAAASIGGRNHPGTTTGISGLIEHEYIATEIAIKLCHMLGRPDLIDKAIAAVIMHDTYKNAWKTPEGIVWGGYNPAHGQVAAHQAEETLNQMEPSQQKILRPILQDIMIADSEHMSNFNRPAPTPLIANDPLLKFIVVMADMLASRKYIYVKHRAVLPLEMEEVVHILLNNSFSIEGEALNNLKKEPALITFINACLKKAKIEINSYKDVPRRAKKMLRVAESLCDLFPTFAEVRPDKKSPLTDEEKERMEKRNEILCAALLYPILRYKYGITEKSSKANFDQAMAQLRKRFRDTNTKERRILDLILEADKKLLGPDRAELRAEDDPRLWIMCTANCMMTAADIKIITDEEVEKFLSNAQEPRIEWAKAEPDEGAVARFAATIEEFMLEEGQRAGFLPVIEKGLLALLNAHHTKNPLTALPPEILDALVRKYKSLLPSQIYSQWYVPLFPKQRKILFDKLSSAIELEGERNKLIEEIDPSHPVTVKKPNLIFRLVALTAMANGIRSVKGLKAKILDPAINTQGIGSYKDFTQIPKAVDRVASIIGTREKIQVYGDYDVDGLTGTAMLVKTLRAWRTKKLSEFMPLKEARKIATETIGCSIPNRRTEGYGLNQRALQRADEEGYKLLITVDCGIKDKNLVEQAKQMGIDFIITDHHDFEKELLPTDAVAIINPKVQFFEEKEEKKGKRKEKHPAYYLSGAAVAYKLARALADRAQINLKDSFLDSVAISIIADVVPMLGENRAFVKVGLERLNSKRRNKGLGAIINALRLQNITEETVAYFIAPLINVLGRAGKHYNALKILMSRGDKEALQLALKAVPYIEWRRDTEDAILEDARSRLDYDPKTDSAITVAGEWDRGAIGLAASRLVSENGVPVVLIATSPPSPFAPDAPAAGSMRTIKIANAIEILRQCASRYEQNTGQPLFIKFGGHEGAGGFSIKNENIPEFQRIFKEVVRDTIGKEKQKLILAGDMESGKKHSKKLQLEEISLEAIKLFYYALSPFGANFEEPLFGLTTRIKQWEVFGKDQRHIKDYLENGTHSTFYNGNQKYVQRILNRREPVRLAVKLGTGMGKEREYVNLIVTGMKGPKKKAA